MTGSGAHTLETAVAALLSPAQAVGEVRREPVVYDAFLAHRELTRLTGRASDGTDWSLIEKRTEGPSLAVPYLRDNAEREFRAFTSGLLESLGTRLRAPRLLGAGRDVDGALTLWQEDVRDTSARPLGRAELLSAAADLGELAGRWAGRLPREPWLFTGWIDRHRQPNAVAAGRDAVSRDEAGVLGGRRDAVIRLIDEQPRRAARLSRLPQTLCHHDAVGANVLRDPAGTVLIDWESVGPGPLGADLASLLVSSVRRGDAMFDDVAACLDDAVAVYSDEAVAAGAAATPHDIEGAFDSAVALRWKLAADLAAAGATGGAVRRGSRPAEAPEAARADLDGLLDLILERASRSPV